MPAAFAIDFATDAATAFAVVYAAMLAVYFATGLTLDALNARTPDRRIQAKRRGEKRKAAEIRASLGALAVSSALMATGWALREAGVGPGAAELTVWSFALWFAVSMVIFDAWFYFGHRLLHLPGMYRFHALHHKSVAPTPWSNDSSGPVDTLIEHGFYLVVWIVTPAPALAIAALRLYDQITGMIGHSGFEHFAGPTARRPWPFVCPTFHDLHHSRFDVNYGNMFSIWDRVCGTTHRDYDAMVARMETGESPSDATDRRRSA